MENPVRGPLPDGLEIIETLGWHPGEGLRHADAHVARMQATAATLGLAFDRGAVADLLAGIAGIAGPGPLRCRLTLGAAGPGLTTAPLAPSPPRWRVAIAKARLDPDDPWLRVKTTQRALYDRDRAALPEGVDEWLYLNSRDELCEGTISNLFVTLADGAQVTPALRSGLLPGVLRGVMLARGWREAVLRPQDLVEARQVAMGNSLRGLIPVSLTGVTG